ncbi:hypothetical protein C0J52_17896 [Blattella germanica]|nr:hypothetical protein C0J52_17896 [Blattella germanica]
MYRGSFPFPSVNEDQILRTSFHAPSQEPQTLALVHKIRGVILSATSLFALLTEGSAALVFRFMLGVVHPLPPTAAVYSLDLLLFILLELPDLKSTVMAIPDKLYLMNIMNIKYNVNRDDLDPEKLDYLKTDSESSHYMETPIIWRESSNAWHVYKICKHDARDSWGQFLYRVQPQASVRLHLVHNHQTETDFNAGTSIKSLVCSESPKNMSHNGIDRNQ